MPTYDYECESCGHVFEAFHGMSENPVIKCPECSDCSKRLISAGAGIIFKGSGFHATDYRSSSSARCGSDTPCCGREQPCEIPPCRE